MAEPSDPMKRVRQTANKFETHRASTEKRAVARWELDIEAFEDKLDGGWVAKCLDLPGCVSQGDTADEAIANVMEVAGAILMLRVAGEEHQVQLVPASQAQ